MNAESVDPTLVRSYLNAVRSELNASVSSTPPARQQQLRDVSQRLELHLFLLQEKALRAESDRTGLAAYNLRGETLERQQPVLQEAIGALSREYQFLTDNYVQYADNNRSIGAFSWRSINGATTFAARMTFLNQRLQEYRSRLNDPNTLRREQEGDDYLQKTGHFKRVTKQGQTFWQQDVWLIKGFPPRFQYINGRWTIDQRGGNSDFSIVPVEGQAREGRRADEVNAAIARLTRINANNFTA